MKIYVLRRGESQPLGPLTATEVADMRNHWQLSDADYFRVEGSDRWNLVGRFSGTFPRRRTIPAALPVLGATFAVLAITLVCAPLFLDESASSDASSTCAVDVSFDRASDLLPAEDIGADVPAPVQDASPSPVGESNI